MNLVRALALALVLAAAGCTTQVYRTHCICDIESEDGTMHMEQETHEFKKRPLLDRILGGIGAVVGWFTS